MYFIIMCLNSEKISNFIENFKNCTNNKYLIYGNDYFLVKELKDILIKESIKMNFKKNFYIFNDKNFINKLIHFNRFNNIINYKELFIIEILDKIKNYELNLLKKINNLNNNNNFKYLLLIINIKKIENLNWFKIFSKKWTIIKVLNIDKICLKKIIEKKLLKDGLVKFNSNIEKKIIINFILNRNYGNICILTQEIEKISIIYYKKIIYLKSLIKYMKNNNKYNLFQIQHYLLKKNLKKISILINYFYYNNFNILNILYILINFINNLLFLKKIYINKFLLNQFYIKNNIFKNQRILLEKNFFYMKKSFLIKILNKLIMLSQKIIIKKGENFFIKFEYYKNYWNNLLWLCFSMILNIKNE